MAIQIRGAQIQNNSVGPTQIDETATYDFSSGVVSVATPTSAAHAATKAYVDAQIPDSLQGGDGIAIDTGTSPDTISVDLATNPGLQFTSNKLDLKIEASKGLAKGANGLATVLKVESGGTISVDASGLFIANSAISNAKLANSTISGVALGSNLNSLSKATNGGVQFSSYNGSAAVGDLQLDISDLAAAAVNVGADSIAIYDADADVTGKEAIADLATAQAGNGIAASSGVFAVQADGSTLTVGAGGVKVSDLGIASGQIAADAVIAGKIADGAVDATAALADSIVSPGKLTFGSRQDVLAPDGATSAFALANEVDPIFDNMVLVYRNGLLQKKVGSAPSDDSEYTVSTAANTTTITFGANISASDSLEVRYLA
jgi:hypothetical protein